MTLLPHSDPLFSSGVIFRQEYYDTSLPSPESVEHEPAASLGGLIVTEIPDSSKLMQDKDDVPDPLQGRAPVIGGKHQLLSYCV